MSAAPSELPTLPVAHARALQLMSQHGASIAEVAAVIESDPALTAAVLRAANSAASIAVRRLGTATDALVRIGMLATRRIIAGAALGQAFRQLERSGIDVNEMWRHLLATALLADATAWPNGPRTEAFSAGLLHDIGRLAMASGDPQRYREVVQRVADGDDVESAELAVFHLDHTAWGVDIAQKWGFPDSLIEGIAGHHHGEGSALAWVTFNGRRVASLLGIGDGVVAAEEPCPLNEASEDYHLVKSLGGAEGLNTKIDWYRGIFATAK